MAKRDVSNTRYSPTEILIIVFYLVILLVIAILVWKLVSPIIAGFTALLIAYVVDLRKLIGRK